MRKYLKASSELYKSFIKYNLLDNYYSLNRDRSLESIFSIWNDYLLEIQEVNMYNPSIVSYMKSNMVLIESFSKNYYILKKNHMKNLINSHTDIEKYFFDYYLMIILPLTIYSIMINHKSANTIVGIQAPQGSGKTTLCNFLSDSILINSNQPCLSLSTDDFYYNYNTLQELKIHSHNQIFQYRGPPGTHEVSLLNNVLLNFKSGFDFEYPVFSKKSNKGYGDRLENINCNGNIYKYLLLEGWFNGIRSVDINELYKETRREYGDKQDFERVLDTRIYINNIIQSKYESIWKLFDGFIVVKPEKYEFSKNWRIETEKSNVGMKSNEIVKFVEYFWETVPPHVYFQNLFHDAINRIGLFKKIDPIILNCDEKREFYI